MLASGKARARFEALVRAHGGDPSESALAQPRRIVAVTAARAGFVGAIEAEALGWIAVALGAGRRHQDDAVDAAAGIKVDARVGDRVEVGQALVELELGTREADVESLAARARAAFTIAEHAPQRRALVLARLQG